MNICIDIHKSLFLFLEDKFPDKKFSKEIVNYFLYVGIIDKKNVLRMLIKTRYHELLRMGNSGRSASLDCAVEFGVSQSFVKKIIYRHRGIK